MIEPEDLSADMLNDQRRIDDIIAAGPKGALALAGVAAAIVVAIWFAFYCLVFLPRTAS